MIKKLKLKFIISANVRFYNLISIFRILNHAKFLSYSFKKRF